MKILTPIEDLFDKKLGCFDGQPLHFRVKNDHNLRYQTPFNIPMKYLPLVKEEVERLEKLGVIEKTTYATYEAPCFIQPKKIKQ